MNRARTLKTVGQSHFVTLVPDEVTAGLLRAFSRTIKIASGWQIRITSPPGGWRSGAPQGACQLQSDSQGEKIMSQVAIEKVPGNRPAGSSTLDEVKTLSDRIRQRAFELFERRGGISGSAMDDWLSAERDLFRIPKIQPGPAGWKNRGPHQRAGVRSRRRSRHSFAGCSDCQRSSTHNTIRPRVLSGSASSTRKRCSAALTCRNRSTWIE